MLLLSGTSCSVTLYLQHHVPVFISAARWTQLDWDSLPAAGVAPGHGPFQGAQQHVSCLRGTCCGVPFPGASVRTRSLTAGCRTS